jgi:predicted molibdopterin-dependent oxidoreductase YjgC
MFKRLRKGPTVKVTIDDTEAAVPEGASVAAAILLNDLGHCRTTAVSGEARAPYCMTGVCFECLMEIDGQANRQACLVTVEDGMKIRRQAGATRLEP